MSTAYNGHRRAFPASKSLNLKPLRLVQQRAQASPKQHSLGKRRATEIETRSDYDDHNERTFLQYCPTCEKQIVFPDSSILYCSESCRRKDQHNPTAVKMAGTSPKMSPSLSLSSFNGSEAESITAPRILPARMPSTLPNLTSKPPELHAFKADLDPTEWKPDSDSRSSSHDLTAHHRTQSSAAFTYLSQFHRSSASFMNMTASRRPGVKTYASTSAVPVVSKTAPEGVGLGLCMSIPVVSTNNSSSSAESSFIKTPDQHSNNTGLSTGRLTEMKIMHSKNKSMDLVTPVFDPVEGESVQDEDAGLEMRMNYAKKNISAAAVEEVAGSLSKLLSDDVAGRV